LLLVPGHFSDDTQMTLFTAEGIADAARSGAPVLQAVHDAYHRWLRTQLGAPGAGSVVGLLGIPDLWVQRAPGNTCLSALIQNAQFDRTPTVAAPPNDSKGCGAVMRSAPFGIACDSRASAFQLARDAGVLTHGHPSGYLSAALFASIVWDVLRGASLAEALGVGLNLLTAETGHEETLAAAVAARDLARGGPPSRGALESLGGGWVGEEALAIALACALAAGDVRTTLWRAVAHAGDSDSTGSLTGNLLGAMLGTSALPADWLASLEMTGVLTNAADTITTL
jgi:ADP-ribosylglycohydrolase